MRIYTLAEQVKFLGLADFSTLRHEMFGLQLKGDSGDIVMVLPGMVVKNVTSSHDGRNRSVMYVSFSTGRCLAAHASARKAELQFDQSTVYEEAYKERCVSLLRQALGNVNNSELDFKAEKVLLAQTKKRVAAQEKASEVRAEARKVAVWTKAVDSRASKRKYDSSINAARKKAKSAAAPASDEQDDGEAIEHEEEEIKDAAGIDQEEELTAEEADMVRACAVAKLASRA